MLSPTSKKYILSIPKLVIFDLDGTLYNSIDTWLKTEKRISKKLNVTFKEKIFKALIGKSIKEHIKNLFPKEKQQRALTLFFSRERKSFLSGFKLFPDSKPLLRYLKSEGIQTAIATGLDRETLKIILNKDNLWEYVDFIITTEEVKKEKPNPEILRQVLRKFKIKPKNTLYIGDAYLDIETAKKAKVKVAIITRGAIRNPKEASKLGADYVFNNFSEFLSTIKHSLTFSENQDYPLKGSDI